MATAFETAVDSASDAVVGYTATALPLIALASIALLGIKYGKRFIRGM